MPSFLQAVSNISFIFHMFRTCREDISNVYLRLPGSNLILGYYLLTPKIQMSLLKPITSSNVILLR